jgi:hypothetical protein
MPVNERNLGNVITATANADLSTKQFHAVKFVANTTDPPGFNMDVQGAANAIAGILQDNPVINQAGGVQVTGITPVAISASAGTITGGTTYLQVDSVAGTGTLIPVSAGVVVALALESLATTASIAIITAELLPSNATQ